jgi:hypothetical protein
MSQERNDASDLQALISKSQEWNDALLATAKRMDEKDLEKAQKKARVALRAAAKLKRDPLKDALKQLSDNLKRDILASNAQLAYDFADLRQHQAECGVLAMFIGDHDKKEGVR